MPVQKSLETYVMHHVFSKLQNYSLKLHIKIDARAHTHTHTHTHTYIYIYIYSSEHKDQNDIKKKSKCYITFYFKASWTIYQGKVKI